MAKKQKLQMRIRYYKDRDAFHLETRCGEDDDWSTEQGYRCSPHVEDPDGEPCMLHYTMLTRLQILADLGYEFVAR